MVCDTLLAQSDGPASWSQNCQCYSGLKFERLLTGTIANSPYRQQPVARSYVSISAGGVRVDLVKLPVFGDQIDDSITSNRLQTKLAGGC